MGFIISDVFGARFRRRNSTLLVSVSYGHAKKKFAIRGPNSTFMLKIRVRLVNKVMEKKLLSVKNSII